MEEIFRIVKTIEGPIAISLLIVIIFLFRHIDSLTKAIIANTAVLEKLVGLVTLLCQVRMTGRKEE